MKQWFHKYTKNVYSITGGGDQTHLNYEIQSYGRVTWLNYRYQALWVFEMALYYSYLYPQRLLTVLVMSVFLRQLRRNYFLHFAGSWYESCL